jgi:octaprenyl-diphosphate synthase
MNRLQLFHKTNEKETMLATQEIGTSVNPISNLYHALNAPMQQVNNLIVSQLSSTVPLVTDLSKHLVVAGGKRIRPLLTLACHGLFLEEPHKAIHLAAAVELIHTATLLHDDVVDRAEKRRGQESANCIWGNSASVLVGDFLFSRAFELMVETNNLRVLKCLSQASSRIAEGEVLQLMHLGHVNVYDIYLKIIDAKTAALFAAACESGALLADAEDQSVEHLKNFGLNLGICFQMMDDILDYTSPDHISGKPKGADFWEGKVTLPILVAYEHGIERPFWEGIFSKDQRTEEDWNEAKKILNNNAIFQLCSIMADTYALKAQNSLNSLSQKGPVWHLLKDVVTYATRRES